MFSLAVGAGCGSLGGYLLSGFVPQRLMPVAVVIFGVATAYTVYEQLTSHQKTVVASDEAATSVPASPKTLQDVTETQSHPSVFPA